MTKITVVSPSTSLILVKNIPNYIYLNPFAVPDFQITVRDTTGSTTLGTSSIVLSTVGGARFTDGSFQYSIENPYGLVNLSLRTSTIWQILHTSGQAPEDSAANVQNLLVSSVSFGLLSTTVKNVSTLVLTNLTTPNSISISSPLVLTNLSSPGFVVIESNVSLFGPASLLNVYGDVSLSKNLFVSGPTQFLSNVSTGFISPLSNVVSISTNLAVGGTLQVGGTVSIGSTLQLASTLQIDTLQVQKSTGIDTFLLRGNATIQRGISTLGFLSVGQSTIVQKDIYIEENISSLSGLFRTRNLTGVQDFTEKGSLFTDNATIISSLAVRQLVSSQGTLQTFSTIITGEDFYTGYFSTLTLNAEKNISSYGPLVFSSMTVAQNFTSYTLRVSSNLSIGGDLVSGRAISTFSSVRIAGNVSVFGDGFLSSLQTGSTVGLGNNLTVSSSLLAQDILVDKNIIVQSSVVNFFPGISPTFNLGLYGSIDVRSNAAIYGNLTVLGNPFVNSIPIGDSYSLSNLEIRTSSPFTSFTASTINASTLRTSFVKLQNNVPIFSTAAILSVQTSNVIASEVQVDSAYTDAFVLGYTSSLAVESKPSVVFDVPTFFAKGFSSMEIRGDSVQANRYEGAFVGDGSRLSNVVLVGLSNVSAATLLVSTLTTSNLYTSSFAIPALYTSNTMNVLSTIFTSTLILDGRQLPAGQPLPLCNTVNQILAFSTNRVVYNKTMYFDSFRNTIGINNSSPIFALDVSGLIYASNVLYSSIIDANGNSGISLSQPSTNLNKFYASSFFVRDYIGFGNIYDSVEAQTTPRRGLNINLVSSFQTGDTVFQITNQELVNSYQCGFFSGTGSLGINSMVRVYPTTGSVGINMFNLSTGTQISTSASLDVSGHFLATNAIMSIMRITATAQAPAFSFSNLSLFGSPNPLYPNSTNQMTVSSTVLRIDNLLNINRYNGCNSPPSVFIKQNRFGLNFEVGGNAYISSTAASNIQINNLYLQSRVV